MSRKTSKRDRKNWRDINRDFHGKKKLQKIIEEEIGNECNNEKLI